ncbi:MAG: hypothetical protein A2958_01270 [Candidatus Levybacteria bacterium RIFCSPLOWO2_01_FULL_38_13]|nr:MAG: hypothetical protein A2629_01130 [Candidatus Levybacteria bacterium RIFCSPHIGHO2_01_FULL_41_15]OGH35785.1 MAG: hypothetical protein A2958_01270 [Candidatus Levybacteria bacterium RIFCSPLOWO2_01_FULL_38_13]
MEKTGENPKEERQESRIEKGFRWYDRYRFLKRAVDFIKRLRGKTKGEIKETTETAVETPSEIRTAPEAETAAVPGETAVAEESAIEPSVGAETAGAEITTEAPLAGTEAGSIIETATAESAGVEAISAGAGAEAAGVGISTGAEVGAAAGLEVGTGTGLTAATGVGAGAGEAAAMGAGVGVGAAGVGTGAAGAGAGTAAVGVGTVGAGAGAVGAGAGAAAATGGVAAVGTGVVAAESNPVGWIITAVILIIVIFVIIIIVATGGGSGSANPATTPNPAISIASCPVPGGTVSFGSYQADTVNGHCGTNYPVECDPNSRRAKSIDVPTEGKNIILPAIEGKSVNWVFANRFDLKKNDCTKPVNGSCGKEFVFVSYLEGNKNWTLFLGHIGFTGLQPGRSYPSGTIVGSSAIDHVHISMGKDIPNPESAPAGSTDTRPGWVAADKELGMCIVSSNTSSNTCTQQYEGTGYCSVANLLPYFGNDPIKALTASLICESESGGYPFKINDNCQTNDYSIGLFQINAVAHCSGAYGAGAWGDQSCDNILSLPLRNACESNWKNPTQNILKASEIRENWASWEPWGVWDTDREDRLSVKNILTKCGISF